MTKDISPAQQLHETLTANGFKRDASSLDNHRYTGLLEAGGRDIAVSISFSNLEFTDLPSVKLLNPDEEAPHVVAHLDVTGEFCFARKRDLVLDRYNVPGTVQLCIEVAKRQLDRALKNPNLPVEIAAEFPQHWASDNGHLVFYDFLADAPKQARVYEIPRHNDSKINLLTTSPDTILRFLPETTPHERRKVLFSPAVVFPVAEDLTFNAGQSPPRTLDDLLRWLDGYDLKARDTALKALAARNGAGLFFIVSSNGCAGIALDRSHPVFKAGGVSKGLIPMMKQAAPSIKVQRITGLRTDLDWMLKRNMYQQSPLDKINITMIGCGTIGSHLAKFLVQSGAGFNGGRLTLIDDQPLEPGNVGRHYLGTSSIGEKKVNALRRRISEEFPEASINPLSKCAEQLIDHLNNQDLIIDATGEEAVSNMINERILKWRREGLAPAAIFVFLFGNGDAAQGLLVDDEKFGCFRCLKNASGKKWRNNPMLSKFQTETISANCGESPFIPYGVAAPAIAASLGLQLALDWRSEKSTPRLRTIRIDNERTKETTNKNPPRQDDCRDCGKG